MLSSPEGFLHIHNKRLGKECKIGTFCRFFRISGVVVWKPISELPFSSFTATVRPRHRAIETLPKDPFPISLSILRSTLITCKLQDADQQSTNVTREAINSKDHCRPIFIECKHGA